MRTGLIGAGIQSSGSPAMHTEEARAQGIALTYELLDLDLIEGGASALPRLMREARTIYAGLNITHPCKQAVIPLLDALSPEAKAIGAVNTVVFRNGQAIGHNTDWSGFSESMKRGLPDARLEHVLLLGAGGAGAAVGYALLALGAPNLYIHDTDEARANALAARLQSLFPKAQLHAIRALDAIATRLDGLVNCTPVGMAKYPGAPLDVAQLRPDQWVADIVYFPLDTELLRRTRALGCATLDGGGMAVFQAAAAFNLFTDRLPDHTRMLARFRERMSAAA